MKYLNIIQTALVIAFFVSAFIPLLFWVFNPVFTFMQVTLKFWWIILFDLISSVVVFYIEDKNDTIF